MCDTIEFITLIHIKRPEDPCDMFLFIYLFIHCGGLAISPRHSCTNYRYTHCYCGTKYLCHVAFYIS